MKLVSLSTQQKQELFGEIKYVPATTAAYPEAIRITNDWQKNYIRKVHVPQLLALAKKHPRMGFPSSGNIFWNKEGEYSLLTLFAEFERKGLLKHIISWAGAWVPRFIRGSRTTLSSHAWGTAFDINAPWNGLGKMPARIGDKGSVRALVPAAEYCGFYWGGNFSRKDGMHFELADKELCAVNSTPTQA